MTWHAIATYEAAGVRNLALSLRSGLYDLKDGFAKSGSAAPAGTQNLVSAPQQYSAAVARIAAEVENGALKAAKLPEATRLCAPLTPNRIFAAAANYTEHANEMGSNPTAKSESSPYVFMKASSSVIGPGDAIRLPARSKQNDWEVELAAVIGRGGRNIPLASALEHVAFYTVLNDITSRDGTKRTDYPFRHDWFRGKSWDTFCPLGPWLVPASLIPNPQKLRLKLEVNGEAMQNDTTGNMIWSVAEQIAYVSEIMTLSPGDVFATGTPAGVGMGRGVFLKPGDRVAATIETIGTLENPVVAG